jgi:hypothetical protein
MAQKLNYLKVPGHYSSKLFLLLSYLLIYPLFKIKRYQQLIEEGMDYLFLLKFNLLKIVRFRRNTLAVLYIKYHNELPPIIEQLSRGIIEQEVNMHNFNEIEAEIEALQELFDSNIHYNQKLTSKYKQMLDLSWQEYTNVIQSYQSYYVKAIKTINHFP